MAASKRKRRMVRVAMVKAVAKWGDVEANFRLLERLASPLEDSRIDVLITQTDRFLLSSPRRRGSILFFGLLDSRSLPSQGQASRE